MSGPWEAYAAAPESGPWDQFQTQPRTAAGLLDSIQAGYQGGLTGLAVRGKLPDVVLDPSQATWYEKAAASTAQVVSELPEMTAGAAIGALAGTAIGGPIGSILGGGAGAFGIPTAIRTALIESYKSGTAQTSGGFLSSAKIVLQQSTKDAGIGALTFGIGAGISRVVGGAIAPLIGESIGVKAATRTIGAAGTAGEVGTMVVAPAALEGKMPEWEDFLNAAIVVGGLKASMGLAHKIGDIYAKTGIPPEQVAGAAKADPKFAEELKSESPALPEMLQKAANDDAARNAILLPEQARAFVEKPFAEVPQAPGTPKVDLNVNYDYINTPAEAKAALARASEVYGPQIIEQTRGKVSWGATEAEAAKRLGEMVQTQDFSLLRMREPGTAESAVDLLLRRQILEGAVEDFASKARTYDPAASAPEQAVQMMAAAERVAMLSAQFQGAASEAGRALNILQNARATARSAEEVTKLLKTYDRDPATIAAIMREVNNPVAAAKVARELVKAAPMEKFAEAMKSAMISGPITWSANIIGNATFLPLRPVLDAVSVPLGLGREILSGKPVDRVRAVEPVARLAGNWQGAVDALMAAGSFLRIYASKPMEGLRELDKMGARKVEVQKRAIEGDLGVAVRTPFLALSVPDRFFRFVIERGEANTIAARQAAKEGLNPFTREFRERMAEVRQNLTPEQQAQVEAIGSRGTFNAELGPLGKSMQDTIRKAGVVGFLIAPFMRTPANIAKELVRLTPAAPLIDTWKADLAKGGPAADRAIAEMVVGTTVGTVVVGLAQAGLITGSGEPDPNKKRVSLAAGEQPYSIKGADGKWYEYSRLQPLGTLVGLTADFSNIVDKFKDPEERDQVLKMIGVAFASAITNQTMLLGLSNMVKAIGEADHYFERYVQQVAAMPIPAALSQWAQLHDSYLREIHGVMDAIKNRVPGQRETLQPKVDVWGEFVENRDRVGGIGPSRIMEPSQDKVKTEAARLGVSAPKTPEYITLPAARDRKLGKVELTPEQQTMYAMIAGRKAHELLAPLVNAPEWDKRPDFIKGLIYQKIFDSARAVARQQVLPDEQRITEAHRIADEIQRRVAPPAQ